jgi:hypothetical protein
LEREQLAEEVPAVHHLNPDDIILNTAKLRDAHIIQHFVSGRPSLDTDQVIRVSVQEEIARKL